MLLFVEHAHRTIAASYAATGRACLRLSDLLYVHVSVAVPVFASVSASVGVSFLFKAHHFSRLWNYLAFSRGLSERSLIIGSRFWNDRPFSRNLPRVAPLYSRAFVRLNIIARLWSHQTFSRRRRECSLFIFARVWSHLTFSRRRRACSLVIFVRLPERSLVFLRASGIPYIFSQPPPGTASPLSFFFGSSDRLLLPFFF